MDPFQAAYTFGRGSSGIVQLLDGPSTVGF
jgi:hypothetical protein